MFDPFILENDLLQYRCGSPSGYFVAMQNQKGWWIKIRCTETGNIITELYTSLKVVTCK